MISIIIPAHNEEKYILPTIDSIRYQKYKDHEIIVVLDGCNDNTLEVIKNKVNKIIVIQNRKGPAFARNRGAEKAIGDILVFLDADTLITENTLKEIEKTKNDWIVGTSIIKPSSKKLKHRIMYFLKNKILCPLGVSNGIIFCKKQTFNYFNGFNEKLQKREDGELVRKIKKMGKFVILNEPVINSTRRFDKKGYIRTILYWVKEEIKPSKGMYEIIR